jgi:peptidoglycan/LPS O-acetylase OafA/YrhL
MKLAPCDSDSAVGISLRSALADLKRRPTGNVPSLDALRCMAILLVFSAHFAGQFRASPSVARFPFFNLGWTGVDLFLVLSGFLIGAQLWKEIKRTQTIQVSQFVMRRGLRIWPLYSCFIALVALKDIAGHRQFALWADIFCVSNYFHNQVGGSWSLSSEEQFYLIAPMLILMLARFVLESEYMGLLPALWFAVVPLVRVVMLHSGVADGDIRLYTPQLIEWPFLKCGLVTFRGERLLCPSSIVQKQGSWALRVL